MGGPATKRCAECREVKPVAKFAWDRATAHWSEYCLTCDQTRPKPPPRARVVATCSVYTCTQPTVPFSRLCAKHEATVPKAYKAQRATAHQMWDRGGHG